MTRFRPIAKYALFADVEMHRASFKFFFLVLGPRHRLTLITRVGGQVMARASTKKQASAPAKKSAAKNPLASAQHKNLHAEQTGAEVPASQLEGQGLSGDKGLPVLPFRVTMSVIR